MPTPFNFPSFRREPESIAAFIAAGHPNKAYKLALLWHVRTFVLGLVVAGLWFFHG